MNIYKISQSANNDYDTYDSAIVCAENELEASKIFPDDDNIYTAKELDDWEHPFYGENRCWCRHIEDVKVELIGKANDNIKKGVILASYNAG